jgi:hypothetical protein
VTGRRPIRWRLLHDLATWRTPEGRLVGFVAGLGLVAAIGMRLLPSYRPVLLTIALACAVLAFAVPIGFLLMRDRDERR